MLMMITDTIPRATRPGATQDVRSFWESGLDRAECVIPDDTFPRAYYQALYEAVKREKTDMRVTMRQGRIFLVRGAKRRENG